MVSASVLAAGPFQVPLVADYALRVEAEVSLFLPNWLLVMNTIIATKTLTKTLLIVVFFLQSVRSSGELLKNLHLDLSALGGNFEYEVRAWERCC